MLAFPLTFPANFLLILLARVWKKQVHKSPDGDSTHHSWTSCNINCNIILACLKCWKTTIMMRPYVCTDNIANFFVCLLYFYVALMFSLSVFLSSCCSLQNGLLCLSPPPQINVTECTYASFSTNFLVSFIVSFYLFMVAFFLLFLVVHFEMYSWFLVSLVVFFSPCFCFFTTFDKLFLWFCLCLLLFFFLHFSVSLVL